MTIRQRSSAILFAAALVLPLTFLAGCESSKDRAARHLKSAMELVQSGDFARATVEFRNVFKLDPQNRDARMAFAGVLRERGSLPEAYGQYRIVVDAAPADLEALQDAARVAADLNDWPDAGRHADAALALAPDDPGMKAVRAGVDYATAMTAGDAAARTAAGERAAALIPALPDSLLLRRIVIDNLVQGGDLAGALQAVDDALTVMPKEKLLFRLRLSVLAAQKDDAGVEAELVKMVGLFPDDASIGQTLLRWYVGKNNLDAAEAFLRGQVATGGLPTQMALVGFLQTYRSADAALAEIDRVLAALPAEAPAADAAKDASGTIAPGTIRALRAGILFDQGHQPEAIKAMQDILAAAQPSDQTRQIRVTLARMYVRTGDLVLARAQVEAVLTEDAGQTEALKLKSAWLIDADKADDAVALLRRAIDTNPRDAEAMTLMARAYDRLGSHDLAGGMLAQAVEASGSAPADTLRYAQFLMADQTYQPAETLLISSLRLNDGNVGLLSELGRLYVQTKDWARAGGVADHLDEIATPEALAASRSMRPAILAGQQNVDAAIGYLQGLGSNDMGTKVTLLRAYLASGQSAKAQALAQDMLAKTPNDPAIRFISAAIQAATGDAAAAEAVFRDLVAQDPSRLAVWSVLIRQMMQQGKLKEAEADTDAALTHLPDAPDLLLFKAGFLEQHRDTEGAIAIYETLYAAHSDNLVVANDLASMLSSAHSDPASLDRAWAIARRLNGTTVPAFADTYGWILMLRGQSDAAVPYLETAAKGLADNPEVQFHLAEAYRALSRADAAQAQYAKVLALVPADDPRDFVQAARKQSGLN
ncbi:MAG: tetratricopeptide repeat protein [Cypionkella sp.]